MDTISGLADATSSSLMAGMARFREVPGWLRAPLQPEQVAAALRDALRDQVAGLRSGVLSLKSVKAKRLFLKDTCGVWEGTYVLKLVDTESGKEQVVRLLGSVFAPGPLTDTAGTAAPFGSPGWRAYLPGLNLLLETEQPDEELAALPRLSDPIQARALLVDILRGSGDLPEGVALTGCGVKILSHKPGSRCTIQYSLEYSADCLTCIPAVIGKIYRKESKARNAYEGMQVLWNTALSDGEIITIAKPLGLLPELKAMIQSTIPGEISQEDMLKDALNNPGAAPALLASLRQTGGGLAAFHQSGAAYGKPQRIEDRFAEIAELTGRLEAVFPGIGENLQPLVAFLTGYAERFPAQADVPTHGTFKPEQVLVSGARIGLIDFDDYSMAEPALDVGLFRSAVKYRGINALEPSEDRPQRLAFLDQINDAFLEAYQACAPVCRERVYLWEALDYLRNCLHTWIKVKPSEPDHALFMLERHLAKMTGA